MPTRVAPGPPATAATPSTRLRLALTHRSHAFEAGGLPTNERLEFLGDAVLGLAVTDHLYRDLPDAPEGRLAKIRASVVNTTSLAEVGRSLGLGAHLLLGRGEEQSGGRDKDSLLADTVEALLGAVYLDAGVEASFALVWRLFGGMVADTAARADTRDHKTTLQELTAALMGTAPLYELAGEGPDHARHFTAVAVVAGERLGHGEGRSKKAAEQAAAAEAVAALRHRFALPSGGDDAASG